MYQIAIDMDYQVGDVLWFKEAPNNQYIRVYNTNFDGKNINNKEMVKEYDFVIRELAFEEIREKHFKKFPSRLKCMYLCDEKQKVIDAFPAFHYKYINKISQVVEVKVTGELVSCDGKYVKRVGCSYNEYKAIAWKYWESASNLANSKSYEYLFIGRVRIKRILCEFRK